MMKFGILTLMLAVAAGGCATHRVVRAPEMNSAAFFLNLPRAGRVEFVSSADNFSILPAHKNRDGIWEIRVPAQAEFKYFYLVDGRVYLPDCPCRETDDFGAVNCIFTKKP